MELTDISILLIEDNPCDIHLIQAFMAKVVGVRYTVTSATSLAEAHERLSQGSYDVILLDLCLPDSEDLVTFQAIHACVPDTPIIVLTALSDETIALMAMQTGAQDYLMKGQVSPTLLSRAIRYAIERKRTERHIRAYQDQLRSLALALTVAEERERRQIAQDLHDQIGQLLVLSKMRLSALQAQSLSQETAADVTSVMHLVEESIKFTRTLTAELSPPILYELGLEAAISWLADDMQERYGLTVAIVNDGAPKHLADEMRGLLFRAVRELLLNIIKHAQVNTATIALQQDAEGIRIVVADSGVGFSASLMAERVYRRGFGLFSIRERLQHVGGCMEIHSTPGQGTRVVLVAPPFC